MMTSVENIYQLFQPDIRTLWACLPEAILCVLALLALVFDVACKSRAARGAASGFVRAALIALFICVCGGAFPATPPVSPYLIFGEIGISQLATSVFILCAFLSLGLSGIVRSRESNAEISAPATTHLILVSTAAASLLLKATNFVAFFVLLETLTVCLYALVGSNRRSPYSLEAGVKYLIVGGVSGGLMLFGIVLLYGGAAMTEFTAALPDPLGYGTISVFLTTNPDNAIGLVGAAMVLAGVMFKLGVFPMQFWIPDVYQGAPTHVTFFLATLSKATGFFLTGTMLVLFYALAAKLVPVLLVCTLISIVYANLTALGQRNVKRLLGLSGVSHAGYLMLGILAVYSSVFVDQRVESPGDVVLMIVLLIAYLVVYIATIYPIFSVMARMPQRDDALQNFDDYAGLVKRNPLLAGTLGFGLGSLAGIPPTVGFIAKLGILYVLFSAGFYGSVAVMLACVVGSVYYYFGWFRAAFSGNDSSSDGEIVPADEKSATFLPLCPCSRVVLVAFSAFMVLGSLVYWFVVSSFSSY